MFKTTCYFTSKVVIKLVLPSEFSFNLSGRLQGYMLHYEHLPSTL